MGFPLLDDLDGSVLVTTTTTRGVSRAERKHLARMRSGEWALVTSWETLGDWATWQRVYSVDNRLGSHPTVDEALARFDEWK